MYPDELNEPIIATICQFTKQLENISNIDKDHKATFRDGKGYSNITIIIDHIVDSIIIIIKKVLLETIIQKYHKKIIDQLEYIKLKHSFII